MVQEKTYRIVDRERSDEALHDEGFIEAFAACADILGACFVFHPVKERASHAFAMLRDIDVAIDRRRISARAGGPPFRARSGRIPRSGIRRIHASFARGGFFARASVGVGLHGPRQGDVRTHVGHAA